MTIHSASNSDPMKTSECFIFGNICVCFSVLGNIDKYIPPYIVDFIICPLVHFALIVFDVGHTLFRWEDTDL